jgi:hypothetical protein
VSEPRILMPSGRGFTKKAFQCALYEAQDVLCQTADVDLVCLQPRSASGFEFRQRWQRRLLYRDITKKLIFANPGLERVRVTKDYDLFVAVCQNYWDLLYLNAVDGWKDRCRTSVCWLDELWIKDLPQCRNWLHVLNQFDHVFLGYAGTVGPLSARLGRPCHWLGAGVDAIRFTPHPEPPPRVVDVYSVGRGFNGIHDALQREAAANQLFYLHDTLDAAAVETLDHRRHRDMYANLAKRSRHFVVAPGKVNLRVETGDQIEIGYRYYEGSAAGAVLIGQAPDCPSFRERFDWPDAVIDVRPDGSDVVKVLSALASQPDRLQRISRRNSTEALLRHDWLYRWKQIFEVAGIARTPGMIVREDRLTQLANLAGDSRASHSPAPTEAHPASC